LTTSFVSELKWSSGSLARRNIAKMVPPEMQAKTMQLMVKELMRFSRLSDCGPRFSSTEHYHMAR
jgi:hypothetical protein